MNNYIHAWRTYVIAIYIMSVSKQKLNLMILMYNSPAVKVSIGCCDIAAGYFSKTKLYS